VQAESSIQGLGKLETLQLLLSIRLAVGMLAVPEDTGSLHPRTWVWKQFVNLSSIALIELAQFFSKGYFIPLRSRSNRFSIVLKAQLQFLCPTEIIGFPLLHGLHLLETRTIGQLRLGVRDQVLILMPLSSMQSGLLPQRINYRSRHGTNCTGVMGRQNKGLVKLGLFVGIKESTGMSSTPPACILQQSIAANLCHILQALGTLLVIHFHLQCSKQAVEQLLLAAIEQLRFLLVIEQRRLHLSNVGCYQSHLVLAAGNRSSLERGSCTMKMFYSIVPASHPLVHGREPLYKDPA
jgi:hypothetical protein